VAKKDLSAAEVNRRKRAIEELNEVMSELDVTGVRLKDVLGDAGINMQKFSALSAETRVNLLRQKEAQLEIAKAFNQTDEQVQALRDDIRLLKKATEGYIDVAGLMHTRVEGLMGITDAWKGSIIALNIAGSQQGESFVTHLQKLSKEADVAANKQKAFGSLVLKGTEAMSGGFYAIVAQTMKLVNGLDQAMVSFQRAHGAADGFVKVIPALEEKFYKLGISAEDAASVMGSLYGSMTGFTRLGPAAQKEVREMTTVLVSLGIDAETSAKNMEIMNRSMGFTGQQAAGITGQLFSLAQQLDISTSKMMEDFTRLGPQLTVYGTQAVNVFVRLEAAAKQSGIEVERLLSIASQFDTFKGAAENVGHLNAVLGGPYLSVMKMVQQTDPSERMKMLAQATQQAGLSFDTMSYYQRKAVAEAAGLQDVNELALVMKNRWDLVGDSVKMNANEIEKLADENKKYKTIQKDLQIALRALAGPATQILTAFKSIAGVVANNTWLIKLLIPVLVSAKIAMFGMQAAAMAVKLGMDAAKASALAFKFAIGGVVVGLGMLAVQMFHKKNSPTLFGKNSGMAMAAQQTAALGSSIGYVGQQARGMSPHMRRLASDINALPDTKLIHINKVFNAEARVLDASKGAAITEHTVRLLAAATAGSAGGQTIQNHMDVTVEMDGRVVGHQVAKQFSDKRHYA